MCLYIFYHHLGCSITAHTDFVGKKDCAIKTRSNKHSSSKLNLEDAGFPCPKCVVPADPDGATYYPSTDAITKAEKIGSTVRLAGVASPSGSGGESLIPTAEMKATMTRPPRSPTTLASLPYPEPEPSPLLLAQLHLFLSPKPGSAAKYALNDSVGMQNTTTLEPTTTSRHWAEATEFVPFGGYAVPPVYQQRDTIYPDRS